MRIFYPEFLRYLFKQDIIGFNNKNLDLKNELVRIFRYLLINVIKQSSNGVNIFISSFNFASS